jgi:hypothetical protein
MPYRHAANTLHICSHLAPRDEARTAKRPTITLTLPLKKRRLGIALSYATFAYFFSPKTKFRKFPVRPAHQPGIPPCTVRNATY